MGAKPSTKERKKGSGKGSPVKRSSPQETDPKSPRQKANKIRMSSAEVSKMEIPPFVRKEIPRRYGLTSDITEGTLLGLITTDLFPLLGEYCKALFAGVVKDHYQFKTSFGSFQTPWECLLHDNKIYVADQGHAEIRIYDAKTHTQMGAFSKEGQKLNNPVAVAIDQDGNFVVPEFSGHQLRVFDPEGKPIRSIGKAGGGDGEWSAPCDIDIHPDTGHILVCDCRNHRVQILGPDGTFLSKFGRQGTKQGELNTPCGARFDIKGNIIVVDKDNSRIQTFSPDGTFLSSFGSSGAGPGQFATPYTLTIDAAGNIIVPDFGNNRIQIFDSNYNFIREFGSDDDFKHPAAVSIDNDGNLYITDYNNNRIVVWG